MSIEHLKNAVGPVPQTEIADPRQVKNNAGGYSFTVDDFARLERFLILGSEGGTYYVGERKLSVDNCKCVERCLAADAARTIKTIVDISFAGRAPKNDQAILALAIATVKGTPAAKALAYEALPKVCRIGTHLYHFAAFREALGAGWGRGFRRAIGEWFNKRPVSDLAYQLVKYQSRDGWGSRDLLNLAHPKPASADHDALYKWAVLGIDAVKMDGQVLPAIVEAMEEAKKPDITQARMLRLIRDYNLPREAIPSQWLTKAEVWEALFERMPLGALVRNLATMTRVGLLAPLSDVTKETVRRLTDSVQLKKSRIHPMAMLVALKTYQSGRGVRGDSVWTPVPAISDALDAGFYASFGNVAPTGKKLLLGIDVSGSMTSAPVAGLQGISARVAAAAMALVTANVEPTYHMLGFSHNLVDLNIYPKMRLDDVVRVMDRIPFGRTDIALPALWAAQHHAKGAAVEAIGIYTDNETYIGSIHPHVALDTYRKKSGLPVKQYVAAMSATEITVAQPDDPHQLDVVGFDSATPALISNFIGGSSSDGLDEE